MGHKCRQDKTYYHGWIACKRSPRWRPTRASPRIQIPRIIGTREESSIDRRSSWQDWAGYSGIRLAQVVPVEDNNHLRQDQNLPLPNANPANCSLWIGDLDYAQIGYQQTRGFPNAMLTENIGRIPS